MAKSKKKLWIAITLIILAFALQYAYNAVEAMPMPGDKDPTGYNLFKDRYFR